jgi:hypothetical protein
MSANTLKVSWYWFRAGLARRWTSYLAIVLLVGLVGGIAIGSVSAARRTQSSFNVFLKGTNPSDMSVLLGATNQTAALSRLPLVRHVATASFSLLGFPAGRNGAPEVPPAIESGDVATFGSMRDEYFSEDKLSVVQGRMANPKLADEFVMTAAAERLMGWHVGQVVPMDFYRFAQEESAGFGSAKVKPALTLTMHLVGTVVLNDEVVLDEVDRYPTPMIFTPALTNPISKGFGYYEYALQLDHGARDVAKVEREIIKVLPRGTVYQFHVTSIVAGQVNRSVEPEAFALGVFGLIAELAMLVIAGGLIARALERDGDDIEILRALGGAPSTTAGASLFGVLASAFAGAVLALVVGVALSPLAPIGPVRPVFPDNGITFDWSVLGAGLAVMVLAFVAQAVVLVRRRSARATLRRLARPPRPSSRIARLFATAGFSLPAVVGVRFATEPGRDRDAVPVRSALVGAALAVMIVVATLTFGDSLDTLISHPDLYGWNWNYALSSGSGSVPPQAARLLNADPYVASWVGFSFPNIQINGLTVPALAISTRSSVNPPLLSGHKVDGPHQIVLGAATMQQLHTHVGATVVASYGTKSDAPIYVPPTRFIVVGTATLPAVGDPLTLHASMGTGAIIPQDVEPAAMRKALASPYATLNGPPMIAVRLRTGAPPAKARASLERIAQAADADFAAVPDGQGGGDSVELLGVQYPAEIENYRSIGLTPAVLALALAVGAVVALALTLTASVRRRRRDLALLRALGFTRRQLMATVAWQASVAGIFGVVLGVPLGVVLGRWLWTLFARAIFAVPDPAVPVVSVLVVAVGAVVLANVVAALPGRSAAKTSTAQVLRGE